MAKTSPAATTDSKLFKRAVIENSHKLYRPSKVDAEGNVITLSRHANPTSEDEIRSWMMTQQHEVRSTEFPGSAFNMWTRKWERRWMPSRAEAMLKLGIRDETETHLPPAA